MTVFVIFSKKISENFSKFEALKPVVLSRFAKLASKGDCSNL